VTATYPNPFIYPTFSACIPQSAGHIVTATGTLKRRSMKDVIDMSVLRAPYPTDLGNYDCVILNLDAGLPPLLSVYDAIWLTITANLSLLSNQSILDGAFHSMSLLIADRETLLLSSQSTLYGSDNPVSPGSTFEAPFGAITQGKFEMQIRKEGGKSTPMFDMSVSTQDLPSSIVNDSQMIALTRNFTYDFALIVIRPATTRVFL